MALKNVSEAPPELYELLEAVAKGEEVLIGKSGVPVAKLIRFTGPAKPRTPGRLKGQIRIAPDFDSLPEEIGEAFGLQK